MTPEAAPTPLQPVNASLCEQHGVRLLVKRLDLVHPSISGNKWYKLKYNLIEAERSGYKTLLSFGGAYSNHIHALAAAGEAYGFNTIGVIRGEEHSPLNPTLQFAVDHGMRLHYLSRSDYRDKNDANVLASLRERFGDFYLIPEGGSNALAVKGCAEISHDLLHELDSDDFTVAGACGTGGTLAGLIAGLQGRGRVLGVAALKGADFLYDDVRALLNQANVADPGNWRIELDYHCGGYAKTTPELFEFIEGFERDYGIVLEPVYTGKLMRALFDLIAKGAFSPGHTIVALHSGGLQGRAGFGL